ncbi:MAG: helix-turn-helix domain-containing protein [Gemmobacter sp.]
MTVPPPETPPPADAWFAPDKTTFGDRLAGAREAQGMTQSGLARAIGVRIETMRNWEDDRAEPRANRLQMLSGVLGVSIRWLLTGEGEGPDGPDERERAPEARAVLAELRRLGAEARQLGERVARAERRLRTLLDRPSGDPL